MQIPAERIISNAAFTDVIIDLILKEDEWLNEAQAERKWEIFVKRASVHERRMRLWMEDVFRRQQADTLANMTATPNRGLRGWLTANKPINAGVIGKDVIDAWVFPLDEWVDRMETVSGVYLTDAMVETGQAELIDLVSDATFEVADPRAQAFINGRSVKFSTDVNVATQDALRASLSEGLATGEGMPALRNRVMDVFANGYGALDVRASKVRADMIARSEIIRASNAGAELAYMQSGVVEAKQWYSALTDRTCSWCLDMHEKTMGLGVPFFEQGDTMTVDDKTIKLDYEEVRYPPLHPRCLCTLLPVVFDVTGVRTAAETTRQEMIDAAGEEGERVLGLSTAVDDLKAQLDDAKANNLGTFGLFEPWEAKTKELATAQKVLSKKIRPVLHQSKGFDLTITPAANMPASYVKNMKSGLKEFTKFLDKDKLDDLAVTISKTTTKRPYYTPNTKTITMTKNSPVTKDIIHEAGHWLEYTNDNIRDKAEVFFHSRTKGEAGKLLGEGYGRTETFKRDKFIDNYMGKFLDNPSVSHQYEEIVSVGMEYMYENPYMLATKDPEYFDFILDLLRGD